MCKPGGKMKITCFYFPPGWKAITFYPGKCHLPPGWMSICVLLYLGLLYIEETVPPPLQLLTAQVMMSILHLRLQKSPC